MARSIAGRGHNRAAALVIVGVLLALSAAGVFLHDLIPFREWTEWFVAVMRSYGSLAAAASIGLMILHSLVPFPAEVLAFANAMVFGPFWGAVVTWTGAMAGAVTAFAIVRRLGRVRVARWMPVRHRQLETWLNDWGVPTLIVLRLLPVVSFNLVNFGAGLAPVRLGRFLWTTAVGILPMTLLITTLGTAAGRGTLQLWIWLLAPAFAGIWFLGRLVRTRRKRHL